jgi:hypothetical protein
MAAGERKRPWYLVVALLATLFFGASGACNGWETMMLYHEPIDPEAAGQAINDPADRAAVVTRVEASLRAHDAAKSRGWPIAVGTLLLGVATLLCTGRAFGGSGGARAALVQLVLAQAALGAVGAWLMRDVLEADVRVFEAKEAASIHEQVPDRDRADDTIRKVGVLLRVRNPVALAVQTLGSVLVVIALTRRRSRDFFESAAAAIGGR